MLIHRCLLTLWCCNIWEQCPGLHGNGFIACAGSRTQIWEHSWCRRSYLPDKKQMSSETEAVGQCEAWCRNRNPGILGAFAWLWGQMCLTCTHIWSTHPISISSHSTSAYLEMPRRVFKVCLNKDLENLSGLVLTMTYSGENFCSL